MFYDSHVHFDGLGPAERWEDALQRAREAGVEKILAVGGSDAMNAAAVQAAQGFPEVVLCALGLDRDRAASDAGNIKEAVERLGADIGRLIAEGTPVCAVGEIGLDFHYRPDNADAQIDIFRSQLSVARELGLPAVVHSREADGSTLEVLREHRTEWRGSADRIGVLHCFTGTMEFAERLLALDLYISFSGIVTFRNADSLRAVAREIPDNRLLIETDTPYLAPVPQRGKPNEPAYLPHVAAKLAEVRGCHIEHIAEITGRNAEKLFSSGNV